MKKLLPLFSILMMFSEISSAQTLIITDDSGNDITNSTFVITGTNGLQKAGMNVALASGVTTNKSIAMRRYEQLACPNTKNYFCWTLCYGEVFAGVKPLWADGSVLIEVDSVFTQFDAYYNQNGVGTDGEFLYVLYDDSNQTDSVWVLVKFDYGNPNCTIAGDLDSNGIINGDEIAGDVNGNGVIDGDEIIGDLSGNGIIDGDEIAGDANGNGVIDNGETDLTGEFYAKAIDINIFPNPARDFFVISNTKKGDIVYLINILGESVYKSSEASSLHKLGKIDKGLYLVKVIRKNKIIYTEKILLK